jgi:hypothetical protein
VQLTGEDRPSTDSVRGQNAQAVDPQTPVCLAARKTRVGRAELAHHIRYRQCRRSGELEILSFSRRSGWRRAGDTSDYVFFFPRSAFWIVESLEG